MSTYEVTVSATIAVVLEAETSAEATEEAINRVFDLEHADASVTVEEAAQVNTHAIR